VPEGEGQEELRVGLKYSLDNRQNYGGIPDLTKERLRDALQKATDKGEEELVAGKKPKRKAADALRKALAVSITEYAPMLVDHAMRATDFDSTLKPADVLKSEPLLDDLMKSLQEAQRVVQEITSSDISKGYIIAKRKEAGYVGPGLQEDRKGLTYEDFHPFRPRQFENDPELEFLAFEGFNKTVDEFFSSIEGQMLESKLHERELTAKKKIEAARNIQAERLGGLQEIQALNERKAAAIQANVERVQEAMDAVNGLVAQGMDWVEIGKLIELQQKRNNPVALTIKLPLKLQENTVTLLLEEEEFIEDDDSAYATDSDVEDSDDEEEKKTAAKRDTAETRLTIDINLALSPWSNAREYYDHKKSAAVKEQKTLQQSTKALKSTEAKIAQDLKKGLKQEKAVLRPVRKQMWFEKFTFFISSDGYLVLGGKDAQQNEILYKKYLRKGDVYIHADLHGAASIVIRNNPKTPHAPIPPSTLAQGGTLAVATSDAWDSKAGMSAWWVNADQVSKSAPTGEFLPTGSFMVRGKKNFMQPAPLLLGFGIMFQISEESKAKHVKHRLLDDEPVGGFKTNDKHSLHSPLMDKDDSEEEENQNLSDLDEDHQPGVESAPVEINEESDDEQEKDEYAHANPLQQADTTEVTSVVEKPPNQEVNDLHIAKLHEIPKPESDQNGESDPEDQSVANKQQSTETQTPSQASSKKGPAPPKRGKKGKAKKIATKYKDQDEDDRLAAQQLIGAAAGREKAEAEAKTKAAREAELAFHRERRQAQHQRTQKETAEHEEVRKLMLSEGIETLADDEAEKMTSLDAFVGTPLPGDEILEAIPVCAPWSAMGKYKYKAKLQPGAQKKGKAVKEILARWAIDSSAKGRVDEESRDTERMWPREVELIKGFKPEEVTNTIPVGKVRVMMAGGAAAGTVKDKGKTQGGGRGGKGSKKSR